MTKRCTSCKRRLRQPSPDGLGPKCRRALRQLEATKGQLAITESDT
jgi:hypothetical protein